jgi:hypothetical protein
VDEDELEKSDGNVASYQKIIRSAIEAGHFAGLRSLHIHQAMEAEVVEFEDYLDDEELAFCVGIFRKCSITLY